MIEGGARPVGGAVADRAVSGEAGLDVVGIGRGCEVCLVASVAVGGHCGEVIVDVTRRARHRSVSARQREWRL